jgi:hypothetical protein
MCDFGKTVRCDALPRMLVSAQIVETNHGCLVLQAHDGWAFQTVGVPWAATSVAVLARHVFFCSLLMA